jgi:alanyl-tRNA synthetase
MKEPFICQLVPVLAEQMGDFFPEIKSGQSLVSKVIREEEESFLRTLDKGIQLLDEIIRKTSADVIDGKVVFELYDTFGFPADLTALIAAEGKKRIDTIGFETELQKQKERSRAATKLETEDWVVLAEGETEFIGYDALECDTRVLKYRKIKAKGKESFQLVLSKTPFYAESGGQVGDTGRLVSANEVVVITDTRKENNLVVHFTDALPEKVEGAFSARVEGDRRANITANHSATHLLHEALREVLGTHVEQKGSLVGPDYLRFDFSHFAKMSDVEAARVESLVNERIRKNFPLEENRSMAIEDARKTGAMMLFGEKYGDVVRVIKFGDSVELCGGTHVRSTGEIGMFRIQSEGAVAAGVRRIEAISSNGAFQFIHSELELLDQIRQSLKAKDVLKSIADLQARNSELQKQIDKFNKEKAAQVKLLLKSKITHVGDVEFITEHVDLEAAELKDVAFQLKSEHTRLFGMFASQSGGKATITCVISEALAAERGLNAGNIIRELAKEINGGGGGQAFFATAGGTNAAGLQSVLDKAKTYIV